MNFRKERGQPVNLRIKGKVPTNPLPRNEFSRSIIL